MELVIEGVRALSDATIRIDGLTVLYGGNGTGKSTVLNALYSVAEPSADFDSVREREVVQAIEEIIRGRRGMSDVLRTLQSHGPAAAYDVLTDRLGDSASSDPQIAEQMEAIGRILGGDADGELMGIMVGRNLRYGFSSIGQVRDPRSGRRAAIRITDGGVASEATVGTEDEFGWSGTTDPMFGAVWCCDTPSVLDGESTVHPYGHRHELCRALVPRTLGLVEELVSRSRTERFGATIGEVLGGEFVMTGSGLGYVSEAGFESKASDLPSGAKVFAILRLLTDNGYLNPGSLLLLDDLDSHLCPKWRRIYAEAVVLLCKDVGVKAVVATRNPLFLDEIRSISAGYGQDVSIYHLVERADGGVGIFQEDGAYRRAMDGPTGFTDDFMSEGRG